MTILRVFDTSDRTADRYTVHIDTDAYLMSHDANMPNGVNLYAGPAELDCWGCWGGLAGEYTEVELWTHLPSGTQKAIIGRLEDYIEEA